MKIISLVFSSTGNTLVATNRLEQALATSGKHDIIHFDGFRIIKQLNLNTHSGHLDNIKVAEDQPSIYTDFKQALPTADVICLASYGWAAGPVPGIHELFSQPDLPDSLFTNIKYCILVSTYGTAPTPTIGRLFTILHHKNPNIQVVGEIDVHTPHNVIFFRSKKGVEDGWPQSELDRLDAFSAEMVTALATTPVPTKHKEPSKEIIKLSQFRLLQTGIDLLIKPLRIDNTKCIRCGRCVEVCPYNAMTIRPMTEQEKEDEQKEIAKAAETTTTSSSKKTHDKIVINNPSECWRCCRCYNWCPVNAISFPSNHSDLRQQFTALPFHAFSQAMKDSTPSASSPALSPVVAKVPSLPSQLSRICIGYSPIPFIIGLIVILLLVLFIARK